MTAIYSHKILSLFLFSLQQHSMNNSSQDLPDHGMEMTQQQQHMLSTPSTPIEKPTEVDKEREMAELLITMDNYKSIVK